MNNYLQPLKSSRLTNMEFGQLMNRHLNDLSTIDPSLLTDPPYNSYVQQITEKFTLYEKGLAQVHKSEETEKISLADTARDIAIDAFSKSLKLNFVSENPAEIEASRSLSILLGTFKNLPKINYEAESLSIDKLIHDLERENYSGKVNLLNIGKYVNRIKVTNQEFKTLFSNRMVTEAMSEVYDLKYIRAEILGIYNDFTAYILAMSKAHHTLLFASTLSLINTARKYYSDLLARRNTVLPVKEQPTA